MFYIYSIGNYISFGPSLSVPSVVVWASVLTYDDTFSLHLGASFSVPRPELTMHAPHSIALVMKVLNSPHSEGTNVQCIPCMVYTYFE